MFDVMSLTPLEVRKRYEDYVESDVHNNYLICAEEVPVELTAFGGTDIIYVFNGSGEPVVYTERIRRGKSSFLQWFQLKAKIKMKFREFFLDKELLGSHLNSTDDYIEITIFKKWWFTWSQGLI